MQMHDMGKKQEETAIASPNPKSVYYPSIHISENIPEEILKKDVGDECEFHIMGKISSKSMSEGQGGKNKSISIDIHKIGTMNYKNSEKKSNFMDRMKKRSYSEK